MNKVIEKKARIHGAYKRLFNLENKDARAVIAHLVKTANVLTPTFTPGKSDVTAFKEGQRHIVCSLLSFINKDTDKLLEQLRELTQEHDETAT